MSQDRLPADPFAPETLGARLVAEMSDALVVSDRAGAIRVWNPAAERIFGFPAAEALGESLLEWGRENLGLTRPANSNLTA